MEKFLRGMLSHPTGYDLRGYDKDLQSSVGIPWQNPSFGESRDKTTVSALC